jgi:hypothetical protein
MKLEPDGAGGLGKSSKEFTYTESATIANPDWPFTGNRSGAGADDSAKEFTYTGSATITDPDWPLTGGNRSVAGASAKEFT